MATRWHSSGFRTASLALACASGCLVGCQPESLSPLYCSGGVAANGQPLAGDCLAISKDLLDRDPTSVGRAYLVFGSVIRAVPDQYSVRRSGKDQYTMFLNGKLAGTIDRSGHWITVKLPGKLGQLSAISLRDDTPGVME